MRQVSVGVIADYRLLRDMHHRCDGDIDEPAEVSAKCNRHR